MKSTILSSPILLALLFIAGCSPDVSPPATTPTPLPVVVKEATPQLTTLPVDADSKSIDETADPPPAETSTLQNQPVEEVVVDTLELRILDHDPVKGTVSVGGIIKDECLAIAGWEQSISDNTLFVHPNLNRLEDDQCLDGQNLFDEIIDLDVQGLSVTEIITGDYFLDVNGFTMDLGLAISSSLLQEEVTACPVGSEGQILYFNEEAGFCLLFLVTFTMRDDEAPNIVSFYGPPLDEHTLEPLQAMLFVNYQESAQGRTLEQIAGERRARYEGTDRELIITPAFLDGKQAILIEGEGEMANTLQIITLHEDIIYAISVVPYRDFPQAADDVELVWNLLLKSFTFIRPLVSQENGQIISLAEFEGLLMEAISSHNYDWLQQLMDETFGFAFWRSQGYETTPEEAIEQLRLTYLQADHTINFEDTLPDLSAGLGEGGDILSVWNPATNPIYALFSTGWGPDGDSEAFLIVTQSPDGILAWDGIILAHGEMGGFAGMDTAIPESPSQAPRETKTGIPQVDFVIDAILSNDLNARQALVRFVTAGCTTADGLGSTPTCENGQAEGTLVDYFPLGGPGEGSYALASEVARFLEFEAGTLYAAYVISEDLPDEPEFPRGTYALFFTKSGGVSHGDSIVLRVDSEGYIVRIDGPGGIPLDFYFQQKAADLMDSPPEPVIFGSEAAEILVYPPGMQPAAGNDG